MSNVNVNEDDRQIMSFLNEDGKKVDFEAIARIYLEEKEYLLLSPVEGDNESDVYIFRVDKIDDKEELNLVEDDEEFLEVKKEYNKLLY